MKNTTTLIVLFAFLVGITFTSCSSSNADQVENTPKEAVVLAEIESHGSYVHWTGSKVIGGSHEGTIDIKSADFQYEGNVLKRGTILIDMSTLKNTDLEGEWNDKLVGHLISPDFFAVDSIPEASFAITNSKAIDAQGNYELTGEMTIKGITKTESFEAHIQNGTNLDVATASIELDRTDYDVKYGSSNFFEGLGDKAISDDFELTIRIETPKR